MFAAGAFFWLLFGLLQGGRSGQLSLAGTTMGTTWQVQLASEGDDPVQLANLKDAIVQLLHTLDREVFSTWTPDSELSRLNRAAVAAPHAVSGPLLDVLQQADGVYRESGGAFDVTIGPLVDLWGFGPEPWTDMPDAAALAGAIANTGMTALQLNTEAGTVLKHKALQLDLSAIAKGYAVDRVTALLLDSGYTDFLVEIGGELRVAGLRADGRSWTIAIETPQGGRREAFARLDSHGEPLALAASGDYRQYRVVDGRHLSHEIDPRTGRPVDHALAAVTVLHDTAALADAWATALMILGPDEGYALADGEGLAAYFIIRGSAGLEQRQTAAFARYLIQQ